MHYWHSIKNYLLSTGMMLLPVALTAQGIYLSSGAQLVMNGAPQLVLNNGGVTNNGVLTAGNSTVWFTGSNNTRMGFIGGSNAVSFYQVVINRQSGDVQMRQNSTVTNSIRMNGGNLLLNTYGLNLGGSGVIMGESEQSHITSTNGGYILAIRTPGQLPVAYDPGNIGIDITTTANPGTFIVMRRHEPQLLSTGKTSIQRVFNITATSSFGVATLRFHYLDAELAGNSESLLTMYKGNGSGLVWAGRDSIDTINNVVVKSGIDKLNLFTLGEDSIGPDGPILVTPPVARQSVPFLTTSPTITDKMQVYPVPAHDYFILTITKDRRQRSEYTLYDEMGHLLQRKKGYLLPGSNNISWDISGYPAGVYYIGVDGKGSGVRIVKQ